VTQNGLTESGEEGRRRREENGMQSVECRTWKTVGDRLGLELAFGLLTYAEALKKRAA
jgi:hypothetical protein